MLATRHSPLVTLPAVALDFDGDGLGRLAGGEGPRAGPGDVVVVASLGGAVHGLERHRHREGAGVSYSGGCLGFLACGFLLQWFGSASIPAGERIMAITVEAIYENGVLRLSEPLPLAEHEKVSVTVAPKTN